MTTTQPAALPEHTIGKHDHPEPHTMCWSDLELGAIKRYAESYALAALQPQPAAAVSDAEWWHGVLGSAGPDLLNLAKQWSDNEVHVYQFVNEAEKIVKAAAQRAIPALRPQAVPSLDTLKQHLACDIECSVYENTVLPAIERWECHHGITAQGAQGEPK